MSKEVGWDSDETYKRSQSGDRINRYRAEQGRRDVIRILAKNGPHEHGMHWLGNRYVNCGLDHNGDGTCLTCDEKDDDGNPKYPVQAKFGCLVMLIKSKTGREWKSVQEVMYWGFGGDKYRALFELREDYGDLTQIDLIVSCTDSQMQKLNFSPTNSESEIDVDALKEQIENAKKWLLLYVRPSTVEQQKKALGYEDAEVEREVERKLDLDDEEDAPQGSDDSGADPEKDEVESIVDEIGDLL